ncbi:hypothetical protein CI1B_59420 [Bradyrhizobium ivorense]|uniref:Uncharacterized protein n=1 Tax=Bradyrhizobium ivorense TaxID=2511166 RepID=A0A508TMR4_9BRAD|nr:hypothetical protein CI1B_59420 [Bradyrhizobium ivorense]
MEDRRMFLAASQTDVIGRSSFAFKFLGPEKIRNNRCNIGACTC